MMLLISSFWIQFILTCYLCTIEVGIGQTVCQGPMIRSIESLTRPNLFNNKIKYELFKKPIRYIKPVVYEYITFPNIYYLDSNNSKKKFVLSPWT